MRTPVGKTKGIVLKNKYSVLVGTFDSICTAGSDDEFFSTSWHANKKLLMVFFLIIDSIVIEVKNELLIFTSECYNTTRE